MNNKSNVTTNQEEKFSLEDFRNFTYQQFEQKIRKNAIEFIQHIMEEEVQLLCGKAFKHKNENQAHRGGSDTGSIILNGNRVPLKKPRVRKNGKEVPLESYSKLHLMENITDVVFKLMINGTSTRSYSEVTEEIENRFGISKSSASRQFIKKSREYLNEINSRKFVNKTFWAIMVDGIHIGGDAIVVALGVDTEGNKHFLGVSQGSTENSEIVNELLNRLTHREISFTEKVVAVLDGGKALHKAITEHFGNKVSIQRCLIHKMRNVVSKLPKKFHDEFTNRTRVAYGLNSYEECKLEFQKIVTWLSGIRRNAMESMKEGLDDIMTLHKIRMPSELRISFYTTNLIDSGFSSPRFKMNRVKRWIQTNDMIKRWVGATLLYQEKQFRKVNRYDLIDQFLEEYSEIKKKIDPERNVA